MELTIQRLTESDYDNILVGWWSDWKWTAPQQDFLPDNGTGGFIVYDGEIPVCAGFVYVTNSSVAWVEWVISNRNYTDREGRKLALRLLIQSLTNISINSGSKYIYTLIKNQSLMKVYEEIGYIKGDSSATEMIKKI
jgi:RimJ/RimL family protein N-acetyltransferase